MEEGRRQVARPFVPRDRRPAASDSAACATPERRSHAGPDGGASRPRKAVWRAVRAIVTREDGDGGTGSGRAPGLGDETNAAVRASRAFSGAAAGSMSVADAPADAGARGGCGSRRPACEASDVRATVSEEAAGGRTALRPSADHCGQTLEWSRRARKAAGTSASEDRRATRRKTPEPRPAPKTAGETAEGERQPILLYAARAPSKPRPTTGEEPDPPATAGREPQTGDPSEGDHRTTVVLNLP